MLRSGSVHFADWTIHDAEIFSESKEVKETFSGKDAAFVYIADETSNVSKWHEYVSVLGGEHYYISRKQMLALQDKFDFSSIPAYF